MVVLPRDSTAAFGAAVHRAGFDILAYNAEIAGLKAIAEALGAQLTDLEGNTRRLAPGETGAIIARGEATRAALVGAVVLCARSCRNC